MPSDAAPCGIAVEFDAVEKRYGSQFALRGVSLRVAAGEFVSLRGANGSGKTTLLRVAALLSRPSTGEIRFLHPNSVALAVKRRMGMVAHPTLLYDELTAEENLIFFGRLYGLTDTVQRAEAALEACGLAARGKYVVRTFSRGMRQRLSIARALLPEPGLLLLDEPTTGLDGQGEAWLAETLSSLHAAGCTILMSSHGESKCSALASRIVWLDRGKVREDTGLNAKVAIETERPLPLSSSQRGGAA